jgi:sugar/nucleoside kinase (ribokinase family)
MSISVARAMRPAQRRIPPLHDARAVAADALDLLVLGDCNPDLVLSGPDLQPAFGQAERLVHDAELTIGGSAAIMACGAARLGLLTAVVAVVGDDLFGRFMIDALDARGVDTSAIVVDPRVRTGLTVILARAQDRAILTFPGAIAALRADGVDPALVARTRHLHVASFFLQTGLAPGLGGLLASARRAGVSTSLDPNWDPAERWDGGLHGLLSHVDVLLPNAAEAAALTGCADPEAAAGALAARGPLVVVKLGADGALAARAGQATIAVAAASIGEPVDAVGAGDSFDAGLLAAWLGGETVADAVALGCACGALSTRAAGGTDAQPTLEQARALREQRVGAGSGPTGSGPAPR